MKRHDLSQHPGQASGRTSLLVVSTVVDTLASFLSTHASAAIEQDWLVHGAANLDRAGFELVGWTSVHHLPLSRGFANPKQLWKAIASLRSLCRELEPDIVHFHTPIAAAVGRLAIGIGFSPNPTVFYTAHGFHAHPHGTRLGNGMAIAAERLCQRFTDKLIVLNEYDYDLAVQRLGFAERNVQLVHGIGVDLTHYCESQDIKSDAVALAAEVGIESKDFVVGFIGELNDNKRPMDLVAALDLCNEPSFVGVFAGEGKFREQINGSTGAGRVSALGRVTDVRPLLELSDVVVSCSKREGLPRGLLEAIAYGRPVITSSARGSVDLAAQSDAIYPVGDIAALASRLSVMGSDETTRQRIAEVQQRDIERYSLTAVSSAILDAYDAAISERSAPADYA